MRESDEVGGPKQTGWRPSTQDRLVRSGKREGAMQMKHCHTKLIPNKSLQTFLLIDVLWDTGFQTFLVMDLSKRWVNNFSLQCTNSASVGR